MAVTTRKFLMVMLMLTVWWQLTRAKSPPFCKGIKKFRVTTRYVWNPKSDGTFVPDNEDSEPGFTPLLCVVHKQNFFLWREYNLLREELVKAIQSQNFTFVRKMLDDHMRNSTVFNYNQSNIDGMLGTPDTRDVVTVTVNANKGAVYVSCFVVILPSPDWFFGFDSFPMCFMNKTTKKYEWFEDEREAIIPMDGGFDRQHQLANVEDPEDPPHYVYQKLHYLGDVGTIQISNTRNNQTKKIAQQRECFPASAKVTRGDGSIVRMDRLEIGDELRVAGDGSISPVYLFSHRDGHVGSRFRRLYLSANLTLTASAGHLVYVIDSTRFEKQRLVAIDQVRVGQHLMASDGSLVRVVRLSWVWDIGLFNPHTLSGELIVDGVRVSVFTRAVQPELARGALSPLRAFHSFGFQSINGLLSSAFKFVQ